MTLRSFLVFVGLYCSSALAEENKLGVEGAEASDRHVFFTLLTVLCADVDIKILCLDRLTSLFLFLVVNGLGGDNASNTALLSLVTENNLSSRKYRGVDATNVAEADKSVLADIVDHKADLVHMSRDHKLFALLWIAEAHCGDHGAHKITAERVDLVFDSVNYNVRHVVLAARRAEGERKLTNQLDSC